MSQSSRQIFVFTIIGYLMMVSERNHHKDVKIEKKKLKYDHPLKRYSGLIVQFSAQNGGEVIKYTLS